MLKLLERVARVREARAQQALSDAISRERAQRTQVEEASMRLRSTDQALLRLQAHEMLDVPRMVLYRDLATSISVDLTHEQDVLSEKCKARAARSGELTGATRYAERTSEWARGEGRAMRQRMERSESEARLEAWLLRELRSPRL